MSSITVIGGETKQNRGDTCTDPSWAGDGVLSCAGRGWWGWAGRAARTGFLNGRGRGGSAPTPCTPWHWAPQPNPQEQPRGRNVLWERGGGAAGEWKSSCSRVTGGRVGSVKCYTLMQFVARHVWHSVNMCILHLMEHVRSWRLNVFCS